MCREETGPVDTSPLRIGYCLSLSGALASNGKTAQLAHQIWLEEVNRNGNLLGRRVELVCLDDQTNPTLVADLYRRLLDVEKVDLWPSGQLAALTMRRFQRTRGKPRSTPYSGR